MDARQKGHIVCSHKTDVHLTACVLRFALSADVRLYSRPDSLGVRVNSYSEGPDFGPGQAHVHICLVRDQTLHRYHLDM